MKTIIALAALAVLSTSALAGDESCHKVQGNWVNAATQSCPTSRADGKSEYLPPKRSCEEVKA